MDLVTDLKKMKPEQINQRFLCNSILCDCIYVLTNMYKDLRFIQALWSLKLIDQKFIDEKDLIPEIVDRFQEEPIDTIKRIKPEIERLLEKCTDNKVKSIIINKLNQVDA